MSVWTAAVVDVDKWNVYLEFYEDGLRKHAQHFLLPADGDTGVKAIVLREIARLRIPPPAITLGAVDLKADPPPPPAPEEIAAAAFVAKADKLKKLRSVLKADDSDVAALEADIQGDLKSHPEYVDFL